MYSHSAFFAFIAILLLFVTISCAAKPDIPVENDDTEIKDVKKGDSSSGRMLDVSFKEAKGMDVATSGKQPGSTYKGALIICEGPTPTSKCFYTRVRSIFIFPVWSRTCKATLVLGNGSVNHAHLWNGGFTGMDYFYERLITCPPGGKACILARQGTLKKILYCCPAGWEAHVVTWGI